jgi:uncharacterized membrane protein
VFLWFFVGGVAHFAMAGTVLRAVPPYIPWPLAAVYISGLFELLGAFGMLVPRTRVAAGVGLIVLTLCVTPANVYMWMNPQLFPEVPAWLLGVRLVMQVLLLGCIGWAARPVR